MKAILPILAAVLLPAFASGPPPHYTVTAGRRATPEEAAFVKDCLCQQNIGDIFPRAAELREIMDTMATVKASIAIRREIIGAKPCSGIYYYKLYSFWPTFLLRGPEYIRRFCLLDKKLIAFSPTDTAANRKLYDKLRPRLTRLLGAGKVQHERQYILAGGIYIR